MAPDTTAAGSTTPAPAGQPASSGTGGEPAGPGRTAAAPTEPSSAAGSSNGRSTAAGSSGLDSTDSTAARRSLAHMVERLRTLAAAVQKAVDTRRAVDPSPDDPFRGLYLGDEEIDRLLSGDVPPIEPIPTTAPAEGRADESGTEPATAGDGTDQIRLLATARRFGLDPTDVDLLLVALAPDVDGRFERFYGYLHDDVTRRRASIGLALELCGLHPADAAARRRLGAVGRLVAGGLVAVEDSDRPFLTRALRVPDRVTAHLLGGDDPDPAVAHLLTRPVPLDVDDTDPAGRLLTRLVGEGGRADALMYVAESPGASGRSYAAAVLAHAGHRALVVDLERLAGAAGGNGSVHGGHTHGGADDVFAAARTLGREARLRGAALIAGPVDVLTERGPEAIRSLADLPGLVVLTGRATWDPHWSPRVPIVLGAEAQTPDQRARTWLAHLDGHVAAGVDAAATTSQFRLTPEQVVDAATAALHQATLEGADVGEEAIRAGARSRNGAGLEKRARRIVPGVSWDDLVLPPHCLAGLKELSSRVRHREQVLQGWAMRPGGGRGQGITALFAGDSGTGKTMSAEVVAGELGLDLYVVDLATVVDKYVGETEKNLERIFTEADGVNGVLLFDEADALFGKRSEVRDAHDRYANIEVAYLLQRMESFDGLAILTTNLRANLDEAFTRRLDSIVDFPLPDEEHRRQLWERCLGGNLPRAGDVDLDFCADRFELTGGNIRSIAITSAYLAAERGGSLSMTDLMRATQREYRKLGRLCTASEFGPWLGLD